MAGGWLHVVKPQVSKSMMCAINNTNNKCIKINRQVKHYNVIVSKDENKFASYAIGQKSSNMKCIMQCRYYQYLLC